MSLSLLGDKYICPSLCEEFGYVAICADEEGKLWMCGQERIIPTSKALRWAKRWEIQAGGLEMRAFEIASVEQALSFPD